VAVPRTAPPVRPAAGSRLSKLAEAAACAALGAALAGAAWSLVDLALVAAIVGGLNGSIAGWRRIHCWRSVAGVLAFVLDSTWALITTAGALLVHLLAVIQRMPGNYVASLSERRDRHVYAKGFTLRRGFLTTIGNVVSGAGLTRSPGRRARVIDRHEHVHVWQARWFGPLYPLVYGAWTVLGAAFGVVAWAARGRKEERLWKVVDTTAYYSNPFEFWAYSREGRWPPPGAIADLTWRRAIGVRHTLGVEPSKSGVSTPKNRVS
jgi:hypothetical protein